MHEGDSLVPWRVFSIVGENLLLFEYPTVLNTPTVLKFQRMVSPTALNTLYGTHDIPHGTEPSHCTHDIPHATEHPSWYSRYPPHLSWYPHGTQDIAHGTHDIPHGTEHPHGTAHTYRVIC